jgi:hypothetical protein
LPALPKRHPGFYRCQAPRQQRREGWQAGDHAGTTAEDAGGKERKEAMSKPKKWDTMTPEEREAWMVKKRDHARKWRAANPEKCRESCRNSRAANPEKKRENDRRWRAENPKKRRGHSRKWRDENPEKSREIDRKCKSKSKTQTAADQFFIMAGAAEALKQITNENDTDITK